MWLVKPVLCRASSYLLLLLVRCNCMRIHMHTCLPEVLDLFHLHEIKIQRIGFNKRNICLFIVNMCNSSSTCEKLYVKSVSIDTDFV